MYLFILSLLSYVIIIIYYIDVSHYFACVIWFSQFLKCIWLLLFFICIHLLLHFACQILLYLNLWIYLNIPTFYLCMLWSAWSSYLQFSIVLLPLLTLMWRKMSLKSTLSCISCRKSEIQSLNDDRKVRPRCPWSHGEALVVSFFPVEAS